MQLSVSHLGYLPSSPKTLTLVGAKGVEMPEWIPFFIRQNCFRMPRDGGQAEGFTPRFPSPYDPLAGNLAPREGSFCHRGELHRMTTRWGTFWQADFTGFRQAGTYQIEIDRQMSVPFAIQDGLYDRLLLGYMNFLRAQRCGVEVYGVHPPCHLDDGVLDANGRPWPVTGGWHDAGDFRKWLAFTLGHLETLATLHQQIDPRLPILEEIAWGNRFFHGMITEEGQVFEDVAGGSAPPGSEYTYERHWWFENHPGCYGDASDNRWTDNRPNSGDERKVRTTYNPFVQFTFVHNQARLAGILGGAAGDHCRELARRAWDYGKRRGHDGRTLFVAAQLRAALELGEWSHADELVVELIRRQDALHDNLSGYFLEKDCVDAYRSIAFAVEPALALLRAWELRRSEPAAKAVKRYITDYLLRDAASNPFGLTPYGVYLDPPYPDQQCFRDAGRGRGVRTFIHPFGGQGLVHGTSSVLLGHAHLLARAGRHFAMLAWSAAAERLLHWTLGHNTVNRSLFTGMGYRQPLGYSFRIPQLPEAPLCGFIGRPDDTPYIEESCAVEWCTQEYWGVPYQHAVCAIAFLKD
jgi:hypothetical protein